jgi:phage-related protein
VRIQFHRSRSGRSYIESFLQALNVQDRAAVLAVFEDIRLYGLSAVGCEFRQLEGKLWEIKIRAPNGGYRFFYVMLAADWMHVLHAYRKQGQKAPKKELEIARKRMKEVLS